jgi:aldehyde:ferredoxin oxidoreductase
MAEIDLRDPQPDDVLNRAKVRYALQTQYLYCLLDSINVCQFVFGPAWQLYASSQLAEAIRLVTGWDVSIDELLRVGKRRLNLMRAFNAREGMGRAEDSLPDKMFKALKGGPSDGVALTREEMKAALDMYYEMAGWRVDTGTPRRETLEDLELGWVADMLEQ